MSTPSSAVESFVRFVLVLFVGLALGLMFLALAAKHTHPGNERPGGPPPPVRPHTSTPHPARTDATP